MVEALLVEAVAPALPARRAAAERPISFGALAGVAIGTIGLAAEWGWSHVWVVNPWPASLFPEAAITGLIAAIAGGVIGGFIGRCLTPAVPRARADPALCAPPSPRSRRSA